MKFPGPDAALLAAYAAHDRALAPKSQAFGQSGREYAYRCANAKKCGRVGTRVATLGQKGAIVERCSWCGSVWDWVDSMTLAGQSSGGRGGRPPAALERTGDLCLIVHDLDRTSELRPGEAEIYTRWLLAGWASQERVAEDATAARLASREWSRGDVRSAIRRSRSWLSDQLTRRGFMLDGGNGGARGRSYA